MSRLKKGGLAAGAVAAMLAVAVPFTGKWEGKRNVAYQDIVGVWTVCNGETRGVKKGDVYSDAQCAEMLRLGLKDFHARIVACNPALANDTSPKRVAAHVSLSYNIGTGGYCKSTVARRYAAGDIAGSCDAFLKWNRAGGREVAGLTRRRKAERELCREGL